MMSPAPRLIFDSRLVPPPVTSASTDDELQAAMLVAPSLIAIHLGEARTAYRAARQRHGQFWQSLDAEYNTLARVLQRQKPDMLGSGNSNCGSAGWWAARVIELRACLTAVERFRSTTGTQFGMSEAERQRALQQSEAAAQQVQA